VSPYGRADIVATLGKVMTYDWDRFLADRIDGLSPEVTKAGLALGGYRLAYADQPGPALRGREADGKLIDQSYGAGFIVKDDGAVDMVVWDSAAFAAGLRSGDRILAINGMEYARARLLEALRASSDPGKKQTELIVRQGRAIRTIALDYSAGIRYPRLEKAGEGDGSLDRLLEPRTR
jgi:predicted metalloprotease with PDZ domain